MFIFILFFGADVITHDKSKLGDLKGLYVLDLANVGLQVPFFFLALIISKTGSKSNGIDCTISTERGAEAGWPLNRHCFR